MNLAAYLDRSARACPGSPAVYAGEKLVFTYSELARRTAALASYLREALDVQRGDRVAIYSENCVEYLEVLHAILWIGAVSVPVNYKLHSKELDFVLGDCSARVLLVSAELAREVSHLRNKPSHVLNLGSDEYKRALGFPCADITYCEPDEVASLFYTSGTTGRPKGVMQTHRNLQAMTLSYLADVDEVDTHDTMVYAAPMSHGAGLYNYVHMLRGAPHLVPNSGGFDPDELLELARSVGRLVLFAAPTMVKRIVDRAVDTQSDPQGFKTIIYGGGPMYVEDLQKALKIFGPRFVQIYGQGECPMAISALARRHIADSEHPRWAERIASVGIAQSMVEVKILSPDGHVLPPGQVGEVAVSGIPVMPGYWGNEEATKKTIVEDWLLTGDTGYMDEDGFITLRDRSKDLIISGGSNIYPREVEEILLTHPDVSEVALVGQQDTEWGEIPVAFIVARPGAKVDSTMLDKLCLDNLARYKRPKSYRMVSTLPKNSYGKVLKTELRTQLTEIQSQEGQ